MKIKKNNHLAPSNFFSGGLQFQNTNVTGNDIGVPSTVVARIIWRREQ